MTLVNCVYERSKDKINGILRKYAYILLIFAYPFQSLFRQTRLRSRNNWTLKDVFAAPKIIAFQDIQAAAGFLEDQRACDIVSQLLSTVHISAVAVAGRVASVQDAAVHAAYRAERGGRAEAIGEFVRTQVLDFGTDDDFVQLFADKAQREWCVVGGGAVATFDVKASAADGVVDNAQLRTLVSGIGYGYGEMRQAVDKVIRTVNWVDNSQAA